jgi:lipoprotein NlpD
MTILQKFFLLFCAIFLVACTDGETSYAPVVDATGIENIPASGVHRVHTGETLYSIAWRYGLDYRQLAMLNKISPAYHVRSGEKLYLRAGAHSVVAPVQQMIISQPVPQTQPDFNVDREPTASVNYWQWPAHGRVLGGFSNTNKGLNIAGTLGAPVYAAAGGKVVYSGHGLRGYGNLIIIKHNSLFLTAYAHNSKNLVLEGQFVKSGQIIAEMGKTGTTRVMLHFEIRREGLPVNPLDYLGRS